MSGSGESGVTTSDEALLLHVASDAVGRLRGGVQLEESIAESVKELGLAVRASRCYVCALVPVDDSTCEIQLYAEWHGEDAGGEPCKTIRLPVPATVLQESHIWEQLSQGALVNELNGFPAPLLEYFHSHRAQSLICVPIRKGNEFWGWLGVDDCSTGRTWSSSVPHALQLVADSIGVACEYREADLERARVSAIFEFSEDAIINKTLDGTVTAWNQAAERIYGYTRAEMIGESVTRLIPESQLDEHRDIMQRLRAGRRIEHHETTRIRKDGTEFTVSLSTSPIYDAGGRLVGAVTIARDITPLQQARAEADAETSRLRELFQHAPAMMALFEGPEHVFTMVNDHFIQAVGGRDVLQKPIHEVLPELTSQGVVDLLDLVFESGKTLTHSEFPVRLDIAGNGVLEERVFNFVIQPFRGADGDVTGILVHAVDLTDHVHARQRVEQLIRAVASERDRLQQVIDVMPEGIAICNTDGQITLSNLLAREIWGQSPPHGGFESYTQLNPLTLELTPYPVDDLSLTRSVRTGETVLGEQMAFKNAVSGELIYVLVNSAALRDGSGNILGGVVVFQDIRTLRDFERQKDEFLQTVTHDLKNPLTTISGNIQLIQRMGHDDPERVEVTVSNIDTATRRAITLVDEILDLTRLQMGRTLEIVPVSVDLLGLIHRIAEQHQSITDQHAIVVQADETDIAGEWDQTRVERVIANLVSNAVNYSPEGGTVTVRVHRESKDGVESAVIEVQDEGLGIPAHEMSRLFERFWRGSNVRQQVAGTGLGLAGAKAIVEAHGGEIVVKSVEQRGSTFTVRLPLVSPLSAVDRS